MEKKGKFLILFVLFLGVFMGILIASRFDFNPRIDAQQPDTMFYSSPHDLEKATIDVARKVGNAVVSISMERTEKVSYPGSNRRFYFNSPFGDNSPFQDDFFQKFFDDFFGGMPEQEFKQHGLGSGVIISKEGYILTNEHVVDNADKLTVKLSDGREFKAKIVGTDPRSDLAIIKIDAKDLPVAELGNSDEVKIGQWVLAIGNPFGFVMENPEPTVTMGVVSALHRSLGRSISGNRDYSDLIQTDAAINPGNSGGPLVNLSGQIIGINVAIFSTSGGYQGIGFAIPVNTARDISSRLIEGKKILYGWLGVNIQNLDEKLVEYFKLKNNKGALVAKVYDDSPAQKAGIKEGDIIVKFNNEDIKNTTELMRVVARAEVGKKVSVVVVRNNSYLTLQVSVGQRPEEKPSETGQKEEEAKAVWRGLSVQSLDENTRKRYNISEDKGVIVVNVESGSAADEAGITAGDIILSINREPVDSIDDYNNLTRKYAKGDVLIRTSRGYFVVKG
jgi:serine protease Do